MNDVEMLKQHGIQKSHARENVLYDAIIRRSTRTTRFPISRFSCTCIFIFSQDELIQVDAGSHQTGTTVIQQTFPRQFKMYSLRQIKL